MEWVETRGRSVDDAKERALIQLGVAADEADFEILEEASSALFGLRKTEARVRARVRPRQPPPKTERRPRKGKGKGRDNRADNKGGNNRGGRGNDRGSRGGSNGSNRGGGRDGENNNRGGNNNRKKKASTGGDRGAGRRNESGAAPKENTVTEELTGDFPVDEQQEVVEEFLSGLLDAFELSGDVSTSADDGALHAAIDGDSLGLLIGPKGGTLRALQELTWTVTQRAAAGRENLSVRVDVAGYATKRRAALEAFAREQAQVVLEEGVGRSLEPMNAADRKAVHDAISEIAGVETTSEGEDPRRRVVIVPG